MKRKISAIAGMLLILASAGNIYANTNSTDAGSCSFNGKEMVSSFDSQINWLYLYLKWNREIL